MAHINTQRNGFASGFTAITRPDDPRNTTAIGLGVLRLGAGTRWQVVTDGETAWLLMQGALSGRAGDSVFEMQRESLFDESASCVHVPTATEVQLEAHIDTELTVYTCANTQPFACRVFAPERVPNEPRGLGQVRDRSLRFVRTIFDDRNSPPEVNLVLGEVVTLPGGWSSYPPHHHAQPEIYHYRFTAPQGYGHAELGEQVVKVRQFDTVCIPPDHDHAQCAAPGYGMYYSWVIRHLPGDRYSVPKFAPEHAWTMARDAQIWWPRELDHDE